MRNSEISNKEMAPTDWVVPMMMTLSMAAYFIQELQINPRFNAQARQRWQELSSYKPPLALCAKIATVALWAWRNPQTEYDLAVLGKAFCISSFMYDLVRKLADGSFVSHARRLRQEGPQVLLEQFRTQSIPVFNDLLPYYDAISRQAASLFFGLSVVAGALGDQKNFEFSPVAKLLVLSFFALTALYVYVARAALPANYPPPFAANNNQQQVFAPPPAQLFSAAQAARSLQQSANLPYVAG